MRTRADELIDTINGATDEDERGDAAHELKELIWRVWRLECKVEDLEHALRNKVAELEAELQYKLTKMENELRMSNEKDTK